MNTALMCAKKHVDKNTQLLQMQLVSVLLLKDHFSTQ